MLGVIPGKRNNKGRSNINTPLTENNSNSGTSIPGSSTAASIIAAGTAVSNLDTDEGVGGCDKYSPPISPSAYNKEVIN